VRSGRGESEKRRRRVEVEGRQGESAD